MKIAHIVLNGSLLLATTHQFASTQSTVRSVAQQIIEEVAPLMKLRCQIQLTEFEHMQFQHTNYLDALLRDMAILVSDALKNQKKIDQAALDKTQQALNRACPLLGQRITELYLRNGLNNWRTGGEYNLPLKWTRLPAFLKHTKNVRHLDLSYNAFVPEEDFSYLESMSQLAVLFVWTGAQGCTTIGRPPKFKNTQLVNLDIAGNDLTLTQIDEALEGRQDKMVRLWISGTKATERELGLLSKMINLNILGLSGLGLTKLPPDFAATKKLLDGLYLDWNTFTKEGLEPICGLENLGVLSVQDNKMTDFPDITKLKKLRILYLRGNNFTNTIRQRINDQAQDLSIAQQSSCKVDWDQAKEDV